MTSKPKQLLAFRESVRQAYFHACEIPELERGIEDLLRRTLNTIDDHIRNKDYEQHTQHEETIYLGSIPGGSTA